MAFFGSGCLSICSFGATQEVERWVATFFPLIFWYFEVWRKIVEILICNDWDSPEDSTVAYTLLLYTIYYTAIIASFDVFR